ncbi:hypothetical protein [Haloferax marisrubri]|uniref:Uncharacterized protein n=1 Tax=Haloferax marisrubri TaxID=1544719 RepID=A0A2P4NSU4_9EURY|nr:hypothetical protein [Haloferax marisrubri]POG56190.1 hypothetical protein AUR65_006655 [Haloferax marisrubri]
MATRRDHVAFAFLGLFGTNAVPHLVKGITGQRHQTPAGEDSSAVANVVWGSANAAVAVGLGWRYRDAVTRETLATAFGTGVLFAVSLASYWSEDE